MLLAELQYGHQMSSRDSHQGKITLILRTNVTVQYKFHCYRVVESFDAIADNFADQNTNFTNITLPGMNLFFQGARVSSAVQAPHLLLRCYSLH